MGIDWAFGQAGVVSGAPVALGAEFVLVEHAGILLGVDGL